MDDSFYTMLLQMLKDGHAIKPGIYKKLTDEEYIEVLKTLEGKR